MKIRSIDKNVKELLSSQYYRIPRFQRPYSWDRDNIIDFWNDIIADRFHEDDYFIGSMVVFQDKNEYLGIVDGQQRITTIILFLCAIRNIFNSEHYDQLALGTHSIIEKTNTFYKKQFVLSTESSYPYFQEKILKYGVSTIDVEAGPEENNIQNAFTLIQSLIEETIKSVKENPSLGEERKKQEIEKPLINIREKILSLKLIFIELEDEDDAYIIFETLNTRGKDLTISDLLRNFFAKNIRPATADIDTAKIQWTKIKKIINDSSSEIDVDTYIHHYWLSKYNYLPSKLLFKTIKKQIKGSNVQNFLNELEINSDYYRQIHETNFIKWQASEKSSRESLDALQLFRVKQQTPLVLSIIRSYRTGSLKIKHVEYFLKAIENFHFIFTAITSQRSSGGISQMYVNAAISLEKASNLHDKNQVLQDFKNKLIERIPTYDEFYINFKSILYTEKITKDRSLVKYILSKYDASFRKGVSVDYNAMTIEHIAPQKASANQLPENIHGMIGNLILVDEDLNNALSNQLFKDKIRILKENKYPLDTILNSATDMDEKTILNRTEHISKVGFKTLWKL